MLPELNNITDNFNENLTPQNTNREMLIEQAYCSVMQLTNNEKISVLSKYAERYGVSL